MTIVTDLQYTIPATKIKVLDWLCDRVSGNNRFQNVIITDGTEGYGKSTLTAADSYYMAWRMKRKLRLFFDVDALSSYAIRTDDEIIIWDDAALAALTLDAYNSSIIKLIKILLLARKKRNTYFINIQEVFRLKEPLIARAIGLNHVYSPDGITLGDYTYHNQAQLSYMYGQWTRSKRKIYKYHSFHGRFPKVLTKIFDEEAYDALKDQAIMSIEAKKKTKPKDEQKIKVLQYKIACSEGLTDKQKSEMFKIPEATLEYWRRDYRNSLRGDNGSDMGLNPEDNKKITMWIGPKSDDYLTTGKQLNKPMFATYNKPKDILENNDSAS